VDPGAPVYHVAVSGDDGGDGSRNDPWATISHAIEEVDDGSVILVGPGEYFGQVRLDRDFDRPVRIV
jgi:pectate disaccharide-lyase